MKKILVLFSMLLCAGMIFAQSIGLKVEDVDITGLNPGDVVEVSIILTEIDNGPANEIWGWGFYFMADPAYFTWLGTPVSPYAGVPYYNPDLPWALGGFQMSHVGGEMAWLGGDGGSSFNVGTTALPITLATFAFQMTAIPPALPHPLPWVGTSKDENAGKDENGWLKVGITEVYYNYYFENFPTANFVDGSVFLAGPGGTEWTGLSSVDPTDWFDPTNWSAGVPEDGVDAVINNVAKAIPTIVGGVAVTGSLTIGPLATLNVALTGGLTTNGLFTNDGVFKVIDGSFIDNGGLAGVGTYEFERYLAPDPDPQSAGTLGWHFVSSPVMNTVSGDFVAYWLKEWDNTGNMYMDIDPWGDGNTVSCEPTDYSFGNVPLNVMQGYSVKLDNDYPIQPGSPVPCPVVIPGNDMTINFGGDVLGTDPGYGDFVPSATDPAMFATDVNTGPYGTTVSWNGVPGAPYPAGPYHEWNLVGNPYSASIDAATFTATFPVGVNASISYWDDVNQTYAVWAAGVGSQYIPPTQGFMVEVNTAGSYPIGVANSDRTHMGAANFYKEEVNDLVTLQATGNGYADKTYIRFHDEATAGFDRVYDAHKLISSTSGVPQIYTTIEGEVLAINALPATSVVPMAFVSDASGEFTIEAIETSEFANVVLEDRMTGEQTDLLTGTYTFNYNVNDNLDRFFVHFTPLGTPELSANSIEIWSNDQKIYVQAPEIDGDIVVFNMMGQEVIRAELVPGLNILPVNDRNSYYVVKVVSSDIARTGKVYVK